MAFVVTYHLFPHALPGGFLGVDVFFVLSGYLITSIIVAEIMATGRFDVGAFYLRRARRLAPALLLLLAVVSAYAALWATPGELHRLREHALWALGYLANWKLIFDGTTYTDLVAGASPLRHTWSLAIEEQFYVVFPLVVLVLMGSRLWMPSRVLRLRLLVVAVVGALASAAVMAQLWGDGTNPSRGYFGTDARAQSLLVGVGFGAVFVGRLPRSGLAARVARVAGAVGGIVLVAALAVSHETSSWLQHGGFLLVALAVGSVISALESAAWLRRPLSCRPLVGLGLISYGVYLWHWPVIVVVDATRAGVDGFPLAGLQLALTLGLSLASYRLIEQPVRRGAIGDIFGRAAAPAVALAVSALVVGLITSTTLPPTDVPTETAAVADARSSAPDVLGSGASSTTAASSVGGSSRGDGREGRGEAGTPVTLPVHAVVLGDSVAHTLAGGTVGAFPSFAPWTPDQSPFDPAAVEVWSVARPACSFLPGVVLADGLVGADLSGFCGDWRGDLDAALIAHPSTVVLVALTNDAFDRRVDGVEVDLGTPAYDRLLYAYLDEVRATASSHGARLALIALPPRVGSFVQPGGADGRREDLLRASYVRYRSTRADVRLLDLSEALCPGGDCARAPTGFDAAWRYDGLHFSAAGARWVATWMADALIDG